MRSISFLILRLVLRIVKRPEERHGNRFDAPFRDQEANGRFGRGLVELLEDRAFVVDALGDADDAVGVYQRRAPARS